MSEVAQTVSPTHEYGPLTVQNYAVQDRYQHAGKADTEVSNRISLATYENSVNVDCSHKLPPNTPSYLSKWRRQLAIEEQSLSNCNFLESQDTFSGNGTGDDLLHLNSQSSLASTSDETSPESQVDEIVPESNLTTRTSSSSSAKHKARCVLLEQQHVHDVYEQTAHHFEKIRLRAWPRVRAFLQDLEPGSLVADVGCGQGKYLHINKSLFKLGSDRSAKLVNIAHNSQHEVMICDNLHLPYRAACFDAVISIGVIHHLTTPTRRAAAVAELARVLRPGGRVMIYVWAMEQKQRKFRSQDVLVPWHMKTKHHKKEIYPDNQDDASDNEVDHLVRGHRSRSHRTKSQEIDDAKSKSPNKPFFQLVFKPRSKSASSPFQFHKEAVSPSLSIVESKISSVPSSSSQPKTKPVKTQSIPSLIKLHLLELFSLSNKQIDKVAIDRKLKEEQIKAEYKELFQKILKEDFENYRRHKPMLEHSMSAPESEVFAVREFPQSSQPRLSKHISLEQKHDISCDTLSISQIKQENIKHENEKKLRSKVFADIDFGSQMKNAEKDHKTFERSQKSHSKLRHKFASADDAKAPSENSEMSIFKDSKRKLMSLQSLPAERSAIFTVGDSDSENESWVHATTKAIRSVESRVEQYYAKSDYHYNVYDRTNLYHDSSVNSNARMQGRNGLSYLDHPRVKTLSQSQFSETSSVSSLSSDTYTSDTSDNEEIGSVFGDNGKSMGKDDFEDDVFDGITNDDRNDKGSDGLHDMFKVVGPNYKRSDSTSSSNIDDSDANKCYLARSLKGAKNHGHNGNGHECDDSKEDTNESFKRFYHVFKEGELSELIKKHVEDLHVIEEYYDHANWCVIAEKVCVWTI